ncbi:MAG: DUF4105 domain-containing protein [Longimicrobiales bacterium]|nr:DUF4105 domain-containing protein [Longimicrobiales bacterium]
MRKPTKVPSEALATAVLLAAPVVLFGSVGMSVAGTPVLTAAEPALPQEPQAFAPASFPILEPAVRAQEAAPGRQEPSSGAQESTPGAHLRVWLVTAGPGDAVWERYGHNAIRILDTRSGRDVSYNWGIFDFQQVDFIPRFLQGRMLYMMAPFSTAAMIDAYGRANREILLQELDLTPAEKVELQTLAEINALPQNRDYIYQYFLDNCSTRVRDLLDAVLGGALEEAFGDVDTGTSYRFHTRRLTQVDPLIYTGMDLLLGAPTDRPITVWEEMFLPLTLRDEIRELSIRRTDGSERRLVLSEEVAVASTRPPAPDRPPGWLWAYMLLGLAMGGVFALLGSEAARSKAWLRRTVLALATAWTALGGVAGTILVLLLFTDHTFAWWNENLFLANPLLLALMVLLPLSGSRPAWRRAALHVALAVAAVAVVGLAWQVAPASRQANAIYFALLLPAHLGLAWGLWRSGYSETAVAQK